MPTPTLPVSLGANKILYYTGGEKYWLVNGRQVGKGIYI